MSATNTYSNFDVIIVGAGPGGISTSCMIKALHPQARICVLDKHSIATRNHGLKIRADSVEKITTVLKNTLSLVVDNEEQVNHLTRLIDIFEEWSGNFIRTATIETTLADEAKNCGITILRGREYRVEEKDFAKLFSWDTPVDVSTRVQRLHRIFKSAEVIIGADGAHSVVRKATTYDKLVDEELLRHLVELKYQTKGEARPRGFLEASMEVSQHGILTFESMSVKSVEGTKPVTLHGFIDKDTYDALRVEEGGILKGVFGNSWSLKDLSEKFEGNKDIRKLHKLFLSHLTNIQERGGNCQEEKISTLTMNIYRSERAYIQYRGKHVLLIGDAESGIVLEGGFNKCLKGVALCARAVTSFLKNDKNEYFEPVPCFEDYEELIVQTFREERDWAKIKNNMLRIAEKAVSSSAISYESSVPIAESSSNMVDSSIAGCTIS